MRTSQPKNCTRFNIKSNSGAINNREIKIGRLLQVSLIRKSHDKFSRAPRCQQRPLFVGFCNKIKISLSIWNFTCKKIPKDSTTRLIKINSLMSNLTQEISICVRQTNLMLSGSFPSPSLKLTWMFKSSYRLLYLTIHAAERLKPKRILHDRRASVKTKKKAKAKARKGEKRD